MKVLLTEEWKVMNKPYHGMVKLRSLIYNMYLIVDTVKLYDKVKNRSFIYSVEDNKVRRYDLKSYAAAKQLTK